MSILPVTHGLSEARAMYIVQMASCGSLAFNLYETAITLAEESAWIYTLPKSSPSRWLHLLTK